MKRVYIIDDEVEMTDSLAMILGGEGFETASQNDGENAVKNILKFKPDLVILDVMFPDNNSAGFELARAIRQERALEKVPILMLSAINDRLFQKGTFSDTDIDEAWMPVTQFVDKPVNPQVLIDKVKALLSGAAK